MISQAEADELLGMLKVPVTTPVLLYPAPGQNRRLDLQSEDKSEKFIVDAYRGRLDLLKGSLQTRGRSIVVLARLDFGGQPHRNPDGEEIPPLHIHRYREGFDFRWATALEPRDFPGLRIQDLWEYFRVECNISNDVELSQALI